MFRLKQRNKYGNKIQFYQGERYSSLKEIRYAKELDLRVRAKDIKAWRRQVRIPIVVNGEKICVYVADFEITRNDDSTEMVEVKGYANKMFRLKWKLLQATFGRENPNITLTIIR